MADVLIIGKAETGEGSVAPSDGTGTASYEPAGFLRSKIILTTAALVISSSTAMAHSTEKEPAAQGGSMSRGELSKGKMSKPKFAKMKKNSDKM
jgi:hypothetical protein